MRTSACVYNLNLERRRKMKNKNFLRVLAIVCVLVLCVGVLAACNKGSGGGNQGDGTGGGGETGGGGSTGNQAGASMNAFVNTMFQSANEIANGTSFELADGKNIALSLGATITLKKDGGVAEKMPIELALKGFLDRQNVIDKYIATANGAYVLIDGKYVSYDASLHEGQTRYSKAVALTEDNETYIDVSARINGVDSFRLIYEKDFLYATIAGNKVGVDLSKLEKTANGQTVKDTLFTKIEGLLENNIVKSVVEAFNGGDFDLNEVITGLINTFVKKEYMPYSDTLVNAASRNRYNLVNGKYVKADNGELVVKTLADTIFEKNISFSGISINETLSNIFGGEEKFYSYFGETLDVQGILTADLKGTPFASNLFSEPTWYTWKNGQFQEANKGYSSVKSDLSQKLSATIALNPFSLGESIAVTKNSAIKLGFEKEKGANGSIGKMSKFFLDLNLPAGTENRTFGIELAITDLKIGNDKDAISTTAVNKDEYGAMNIDAGLDFNFGEDLLSLVAHDHTNPNGLTIKVGGDDLKYDEATKTLTVPKTLKLNIKGTLDFVNIQNTRAVATITANDKVFAKLQLKSVPLGTDDFDLQLDAKIMDKYINIVPSILDLCVYMGKNGGIGIYGFQQNEKGNWGFYDKKTEYVEATDGVYGKDAAGNYYLITDDKPVGADGKKYNQMVTYTTKEYVHFYYVEAENGPYGVKTVKLKKDYYKLSSAESETYKGKRYDRYKANYSYEKLNNALDHFIKTGEAHVTGLNFVNIINNFIGGNDKNILMNFEKPASASADGDITIDDIIMSLLLKDNMGIIPAVYGLIGINQADGLHNSLVIGGENLLATTFKNLFGYNNSDDDKDDKDDKGVYIDAVSMVALAIKYFTNYKVDLKGKTYDSVAVYKEFETELYKLTARGIYAQGLSKQLMLLRPEGYMTDGEKFFADNKETATTAIMHENGYKEYAVVEDSAGNKYLYPYVLYAELELAAKKNNVKYLSDEGFSLVDGKLVLINTPDGPNGLKEAIANELNNPTDGTKYTESNYIDGKAGSLLRQAYRLGKTYVPYFDKTANSWKVEEIAAAGTSANAEIIDDIALKVIIGTRKDGDRVTYGTATVEGKVYGKPFSIKGYVNFLTKAPEITKENLISDETKGKAFEIQIINPQTYNK